MFGLEPLDQRGPAIIILTINYDFDNRLDLLADIDWHSGTEKILSIKRQQLNRQCCNISFSFFI
jgi:hypothetical protein